MSKQGTIQRRIFRKIETKRRCCADYIGSDSITSVSNCFYYMIAIDLSVITDRLICTEYLCIVNLSRPSMKDVGCQTKTTVSQSWQVGVYF